MDTTLYQVEFAGGVFTEIIANMITVSLYMAPVTERVWTTLGPEFGKDARKTAMIVRALYGLKLADAAFRSHFAKCIKSFGYQSCKADPDLWLKPKIRQEDGVKYYSYLLSYASITIQALC